MTDSSKDRSSLIQVTGCGDEFDYRDLESLLIQRYFNEGKFNKAL